MEPLTLAFLGSAPFSVPTLKALTAAGHRVVAVYTQPPRPSGRGYRLAPSPVHAFALSAGLSVRTPETLKDEPTRAAFAGLGLDAAVVAAYGLILPEAVLRAPRLGCFNVHASLLPRWRGAAPIERAILEGDPVTGVTIMQVEAGLDTGPILLSQEVPITADTTAADLHRSLADLGAKLMIEALAEAAAGTLKPRPQPTDGATYARKLDRDEGRIDWSRPAERIERAVRALNPVPGVWFTCGGERIRVLTAQVTHGQGVPGTVLDAGPTVACGEGALRLKTVQRAGRAALDVSDFLRGFPLPVGTALE